MLKWVVKSNGRSDSDDNSSMVGNYRTLSEGRHNDINHRRQTSVDSTVSSAPSTASALERQGRPKKRKHVRGTRAKSTNAVNKVKDKGVINHQPLTGHLDSGYSSDKNKDNQTTNYCKVRDWKLNVDQVDHGIDAVEGIDLDIISTNEASSPSWENKSTNAKNYITTIQSRDKLTNFGDVSVNAHDLSDDLVARDEGIDVKEEPSDFDPNVVCGSKMSMMDESFEQNDAKSEHSENGDSSTDSGVVMGDDLQSPEQSPATSPTKPIPPPRNRSRKRSMEKTAQKVITEGKITDDVIIMDEDEEENLKTNIFIRGSDPFHQTARGKLQSRRSKLNDQINLQLRLRTGAENLYKATTNKKLRETVALELSYLNSTLQLLKEELADLNSSVQIYQNNGSTQCAPMIPLGLKETKDVDFMRPFMEMIGNHYNEDSKKFLKDIQHVIDMRQACRTPLRNEEGIKLLYEYYNLLYFVDRRFFPPYKSLGIYFEWFDSLTGVPNAQRTVGFEKGSILFNIGALHTQIGARQDRSTERGILKAMECFKQAGGALQYLNDNFSNAPSTDMQPDTLNMLVQLMMAQAQECVFEHKALGGTPSGIKPNVDIGHEASLVYFMYRRARELMLFDQLKPHIPQSWISMATVKGEYFRALSHYHAAVALLTLLDNNEPADAKQFENLHLKDASSRRLLEACVITLPPKTAHERKLLAKAHLRESILSHEEALRVHGMNKQLRKMDTFQEILKLSHDQSLQMYAELEEEDDFTELMAVPNLQGRTSQPTQVIPPDFLKYKVVDLFQELGPLAIFSARHQWTPPRRIDIKKLPTQEYGFSVRGDSPVIIAAVESKSLAHKCGLCVGDFIVTVSGADIKWSQHEEVVNLIRDAGDHLIIDIITPMDRNYLSPGTIPKQPLHKAATIAGRPSMSRPALGEGTLKKNSKNKSGSTKSVVKSVKESVWTLRRNRSKSREKKFEITS